MGYVLTIAYFFVLILIMHRVNFFKINGVSDKLMLTFFVLKVLSGFGLIFLYTFYYTERATADVFKYFDDGNILFSAIYEHPLDYLRMLTGIDGDAPQLFSYYDSTLSWFKGHNYDLLNDNRTMVRFNALVRLISTGNIFVHSLLMSFLSFTGLTAIYKTFSENFNGRYYLLTIAIFLIPSVLFWTSGILKEGLLIFSLGILLYSCYRSFTGTFKIKYVIAILCAGILLFLTKFYVLVAISPGLLSILFIRITGKKFVLLKAVTIHLLFIILCINSIHITGKYDIPEILSNKQHDFVNYVNSLPAVGSEINIRNLEPTTLSILKNAPFALFNSFFRPHVFEAHSIVSLISAVENLLTVLLLIICLFLSDLRKLKADAYIYLAISFTLITFLLGGLITPVLGALVRYKVPALPFLWLLIFYLPSDEKLNRIYERIPFISKIGVFFR